MPLANQNEKPIADVFRIFSEKLSAKEQLEPEEILEFVQKSFDNAPEVIAAISKSFDVVSMRKNNDFESLKKDYVTQIAKIAIIEDLINKLAKAEEKTDNCLLGKFPSIMALQFVNFLKTQQWATIVWFPNKELENTRISDYARIVEISVVPAKSWSEKTIFQIHLKDYVSETEYDALCKIYLKFEQYHRG